MYNTVISLSSKELLDIEKRFCSLFFKIYITRLRKLSLECKLTVSWHRSTVQTFAIEIAETVLS